MSAATPAPAPAPAPAPTLPLPAPPPARLPHRFHFSAWATLVRVSVEQLVRGRRLLALVAVFCLPAAIALATRYGNGDFANVRGEVEEALVFYMIPQALVPLTALILASGMVRDEVEGQTLTYLLIRPLPRPSIYAAKLLAAWFVSAALAAVFATVALAVIHWGAEGFWGGVIPRRAAEVAALSALSLAVYVSLFGGLSLVVKWVLPLGVAYIALFEGLFANVDFAVRRLTVLWYVRILAERWLGLHVESWSINLEEAPSGTEAFLTLAAAAVVLATASAWFFGAREIRLKTPEGG